jgi:hypothetical protein
MKDNEKDTTKIMAVARTELRIVFIISFSYATHQQRSFSGRSNSFLSQDSNHEMLFVPHDNH